MIQLKIIIREPELNEEDSVTISVKYMTEDIMRAINLLKSPRQLTVYIDNKAFSLAVSDIFYIESVDLKTFVYAERTVYQAKLKLYEVEDFLSKDEFMRINRQTIINIKKIKSFAPAGNGRFQVTLINGEDLIISRQNVATLKEVFGI